MIIWPEYISLKDWAGDLVARYSQNSLPILFDEKKWEDWGAMVASTSEFYKVGVPAPFIIDQGKKKPQFKTWQEWAKTMYVMMNYQIEPNKI